MQRVFSGILDVDKLPIPNKAESYLLEGFQVNGGTIEAVNISIGGGIGTTVKSLVIRYEDNGKYKEIMIFLDGKEDKLRSWMKDFW